MDYPSHGIGRTILAPKVEFKRGSALKTVT
jgi:hypothetical protein